MTNATPSAYHSVTPWIVSDDTGAMIEYLQAAFGAEERGRVYDDGRIAHAEVQLGDSVIMLFDRHEHWPAIPSLLRLYVEDGDDVFTRAIAAGGTAVTEMTELAFGDRSGRVRDPAGNIWWIQTHARDLTPDEIAARMQAPHFAAAMRYMQETLDVELKARG